MCSFLPSRSRKGDTYAEPEPSSLVHWKSSGAAITSFSWHFVSLPSSTSGLSVSQSVFYAKLFFLCMPNKILNGITLGVNIWGLFFQKGSSLLLNQGFLKHILSSRAAIAIAHNTSASNALLAMLFPNFWTCFQISYHLFSIVHHEQNCSHPDALCFLQFHCGFCIFHKEGILCIWYFSCLLHARQMALTSENRKSETAHSFSTTFCIAFT